jgi:choline kinase
MIKDGVGTNYEGVKISYIENPDWEKGNLQSLLVAEKHLKEKFLLCMSDHLFDFDIVKQLLDHHTDKSVLLAVEKKKATKEDTKVLSIEENLIQDIGKNVVGNYVDTGFFLCLPKVFEYAKEAARVNTYELSDCIRIASQNKDAEILDIGKYFWLDIDAPKDLENYYNKKNEKEFPSLLFRT